MVDEPDDCVAEPVSDDDDIDPVALPDIVADAGSAAMDPYAEQSGVGAEGQDSCVESSASHLSCNLNFR